MQVAKKLAFERYQLTLKIVQFNDYTLPNVALSDGSIDANMFQHQPYLTQTITARGYDLVSAGKTFIYPMAAYSKRVKNISSLQRKATIAVPNDPSNEARALLLLQSAGIITLKTGVTVSATVHDIVKNPKTLRLKTLDAATLPRVLDDVDLAIINSNYAVAARLLPKRDGILLEDANSEYANIVAVRRADRATPKVKQLMSILQSDALAKAAKTLFKGQAIPAWK